jgi:alkanesulfonate monooxygenase SsuD/methylene tetrahydromethanopterin reductase-like flavin-dependent oxidoreductase (luciferase family)
MSTVLQLSLAVGPAGVSLAEAVTIAAAAEEAGIAAIRLTDGGALDPTVVAAYLAGLHGGIGYIAEIPTTHNAPYNVARRVLSLDRATGGRAGVALLAGAGDEVSEATVPDPGAVDPARRWSEYAVVLTRLWESFPRAALIGDQAAGLVVDEALIEPIGHEGSFYRVAGPLDGPSSVQGRPAIVADLGVLDVTTVAASADVVVVDRERVPGTDAALAQALRQVGRPRRDVALLGRVGSAVDDDLVAWAEEHRLDGFEVASLHGVRRGPTLRGRLGLAAVAA